MSDSLYLARFISCWLCNYVFVHSSTNIHWRYIVLVGEGCSIQPCCPSPSIFVQDVEELRGGKEKNWPKLTLPDPW